MGGWKESGIGYRHGEPGIKKYCRIESTVVTRFAGKREPSWYPYNEGSSGSYQPDFAGGQRPRSEAPSRPARLT